MVYRGRYSTDLAQIFDLHTARHTTGPERIDFACRTWEVLPESAFVLHGGVFELGRCFYHASLKQSPGSTEQMIAEIAKAFQFDAYNGGRGGVHYGGVRDWVHWVHEARDEALDWRDRFYLEQRIAGWLSSIEQGQDLIGRDRGHLVNSRHLLQTILALPPDVRCGSQHHVDLIARMAPQLLEYPFNPPDRYLKRLLGKTKRRVVNEVSALGDAAKKSEHLAQRVGAARAKLVRSLRRG
jgi:hypothetical protein